MAKAPTRSPKPAPAAKPVGGKPAPAAKPGPAKPAPAGKTPGKPASRGR